MMKYVLSFLLAFASCISSAYCATPLHIYKSTRDSLHPTADTLYTEPIIFLHNDSTALTGNAELQLYRIKHDTGYAWLMQTHSQGCTKERDPMITLRLSLMADTGSFTLDYITGCFPIRNSEELSEYNEVAWYEMSEPFLSRFANANMISISLKGSNKQYEYDFSPEEIATLAATYEEMKSER